MKQLNPETLTHRKDGELLREFQGLAVDGSSGELTLRFATVTGEPRQLQEADLPFYLRECEALLSPTTGDLFRQRQLGERRRELVQQEFYALKLADIKLRTQQAELHRDQCTLVFVNEALEAIAQAPPNRAAKLEAIYRGWQKSAP